MSQRTEDICLDADWLSLDYLIAECIWDPSDNESDDGETLHPELLRYLTREAVERGDFTLRFWRGEFYSWADGRYVRVSESDMKSRLVCHLKEHNRHAETFGNSLLMTEENDDRPVTAKLTPHYFTLTKLPYDFDPQDECPWWREFLADVMQGDAERIEMLSQ